MSSKYFEPSKFIRKMEQQSVSFDPLIRQRENLKPTLSRDKPISLDLQSEAKLQTGHPSSIRPFSQP